MASVTTVLASEFLKRGPRPVPSLRVVPRPRRIGVRKPLGEVMEGPDGVVYVFKVEELWKRVRRWARRNGKEYIPTYGVKGVAPT